MPQRSEAACPIETPLLTPETYNRFLLPRPSPLVIPHLTSETRAPALFSLLSANPHRLVEISEGLQQNALHIGALQLRVEKQVLGICHLEITRVAFVKTQPCK